MGYWDINLNELEMDK